LTEQVLVTGASGFIGYHLVRSLVETGREVYCLVRPTSNIRQLESFDVSFLEGDVTRKETLIKGVDQVEIVFHLAGSTAVFKPETHFQVNEGGTRNIAEACAESGVPKRLVIVSSSAAVGPSPRDRPMTEDDPPSPVSYYGRSKLAGAQAARRWAGKIPITIIRPAIVFGEYDRDAFRMFDLVAHGWHLVPGLKKRYFSLIHAADLAKALILAAEKGERLPSQDEEPISPGQGSYFIADEWAPSYAELGPMMAQALGHKVKVVNVPGLIVWGVAVVNEILARLRRQPTILNLDKAREGLFGSWVYSPEKAKRQLGFKPDATILERIHQTGMWYQEQGWL
jgi:nucleoside-diphosphate-sugar epimerase